MKPIEHSSSPTRATYQSRILSIVYSVNNAQIQVINTISRLKAMFISFAILAVVGATVPRPALALDTPDWGAIAIDTFETFGADIDNIPEKTEGYDVDTWRFTSIADVSAAGVAACAIPFFHLGALAAEFPYFLRGVYNSALGMGELIYGEISQEDFEVIMALWTGESLESIGNLEYLADVASWAASVYGRSALNMSFAALSIKFDLASKAADGSTLAGIVDDVSDAINLEVSKKLLSKFLAKKLGAKAGAKMSAKVATAVAKKILIKFGSKVAMAFVPLVGAAACGGANGWLMSTVLDSSEEYYRTKSALLSN